VVSYHDVDGSGGLINIPSVNDSLSVPFFFVVLAKAANLVTATFVQRSLRVPEFSPFLIPLVKCFLCEDENYQTDLGVWPLTNIRVYRTARP